MGPQHRAAPVARRTGGCRFHGLHTASYRGQRAGGIGGGIQSWGGGKALGSDVVVLSDLWIKRGAECDPDVELSSSSHFYVSRICSSRRVDCVWSEYF